MNKVVEYLLKKDAVSELDMLIRSLFNDSDIEGGHFTVEIIMELYAIFSALDKDLQIKFLDEIESKSFIDGEMLMIAPEFAHAFNFTLRCFRSRNKSIEGINVANAFWQLAQEKLLD